MRKGDHKPEHSKRCCKKCNITKSISQFPKRPWKQYMYHQHTCLTCFRDERLIWRKNHQKDLKRYRKVFQKKHRERLRLIKLAYNKAHRKENVIKARLWQRANPEKVKRTQKKWRKSHSEHIRINHKKWRESHRENLKFYYRKWKANPEYQEKNKRRCRLFSKRYRKRFIKLILEKQRKDRFNLTDPCVRATLRQRGFKGLPISESLIKSQRRVLEGVRKIKQINNNN